MNVSWASWISTWVMAAVAAKEVVLPSETQAVALDVTFPLKARKLFATEVLRVRVLLAKVNAPFVVTPLALVKFRVQDALLPKSIADGVFGN